jgi:predicted signal transduction protein with EAL and GGDEF domain
LREDIKLLNVLHAGQLLGSVTLSIGIAAFPENGESALALVEAADAALYRAKQEGRDRIVVALALNLQSKMQEASHAAVSSEAGFAGRAPQD